jgi:hypothetical protein
MLHGSSLLAIVAYAVAGSPRLRDVLSPAIDLATGSCRVRTNSSAYTEFSTRTCDTMHSAECFFLLSGLADQRQISLRPWLLIKIRIHWSR